MIIRNEGSDPVRGKKVVECFKFRSYYCFIAVIFRFLLTSLFSFSYVYESKIPTFIVPTNYFQQL